MSYSDKQQPFPVCKQPTILFRDDNFLSTEQVLKYQDLLKNNSWSLGFNETLDELFYVSQSLYRHYAWDGDWQSPRWLDTTPPDWEQLYQDIANYLPPHFVHWVDVKITGSYQNGTPLHRDKDPWKPGGDIEKFDKSITVLCNLNTAWDAGWGGGLVLYSTDEHRQNTVFQTVPITPGQLLIIENCVHSIETITEPSKSRVSFVLQVLREKVSIANDA